MSNNRPPTNSESHFSTTHLNADLKGRTVRGGATTLVGQVAKFILQLGSTVILARLLTPQDFGLIAMVAAVTGFISIFKDLGLSMATVQKEEINQGQISALFWINVGISIVLTLFAMALAPVIAWFYEEPDLTWVTIVLASAFIFGGLTVQHQALLRRQMRFAALAAIDVISMAAGVAAGVISSFSGLGYWSLVIMQLVTAITMAVGVWIACGWLPGWPVRHSGVREMLAFGGYLTGFSVVNYFARNLDNILLGRVWGSQSVGIYSRAYSLMLLPIGQITAPITAVAVPALSRLQNEPERYRNFYLKAIRLIAYATMPIVVAMAVLSTEIIGLVLGEQWQDAAPIFLILSLSAILQPVATTVGWIYVSLGQTKRMFLWVCVAAPVIVSSFLVGLRWGAVGVATGYTIAIYILIIPQFAFAVKYSPVSVRDVALNLYRPLMLSIIMGLVMVVVRGYVTSSGLVSTIAICLLAGVLVLLLLARTVKSIWIEIKDIGETGKIIFSKKT